VALAHQLGLVEKRFGAAWVLEYGGAVVGRANIYQRILHNDLP